MRKEVISDSVTLYHGDSREVIANHLQGVVLDAVVTDPPYGIEELVGGYGRTQIHDKEWRNIAGDIDTKAIEDVLPVVARNITRGWVVAFYSCRNTPDFIRATSKLTWYGELIWDKVRPGLGFSPIRYVHENIAVFVVGEPPKLDKEDPKGQILSELRCSVVAKDHPHQKPIEIMAPIVQWAAPPGGLVMDPFMGSGSTGVACCKTGRRFIGVEKDAKHFETCVRRLNEVAHQDGLFT